MRLRWPVFLMSVSLLFMSCTSHARRESDVQPAPEFLFERRPFQFDCADRTPGQSVMNERGTRLSIGNEAPFLLTRSEEATLSIRDVPALTIQPIRSTRFPGGSGKSDWSIRFCAQGEGSSESEARGHLDQVSMTFLGATVSLKGPILAEKPQIRGSFFLDAPADAPVVIHASFTAVEIRDMAGPVRVTATHARAKILDTTGQVDASAFVIDFAGSRGRVNLSAEAEINLKMTAPRFDGTLMAWAQRPLRTRGLPIHNALSSIGEQTRRLCLPRRLLLEGEEGKKERPICVHLYRRWRGCSRTGTPTIRTSDHRD